MIISVISAPAAAWAIQWSPDNATWFPVSGVTLMLAVVNAIPAGFTGAITLQGGGYIRLNGGNGGTFDIGAQA